MTEPELPPQQSRYSEELNHLTGGNNKEIFYLRTYLTLTP
jgi:hypothetical protein